MKFGHSVHMSSVIMTHCRAWISAAIVIVLGCQQEMADQPRYEPLEASAVFSDGRSARQPIPGTVARGHLRTDSHLYAGRVDGELVDRFPFPITRPVLERGRERYQIFCLPCHDGVGRGQGVIVQRGLRAPPSFHQPRLRDAPVGHFFDVMTNGLGGMYDYRDRIPVRDRWAIVAYVRALQRSQHASITDVPETKRAELSG